MIQIKKFKNNEANKLRAFLALGITIGLLISVPAVLGLRNEIKTLKVDNQILVSQQEQLMSLYPEYIPVKVTATGYAPLDPNAVEGVCYSGDPTVTASGAKSDPNKTVAMGSAYGFGTQVYIPGIGYRVVQDRGGAIKDNNIDIMFATQEQALEYGRQEITIFVKVVDND